MICWDCCGEGGLDGVGWWGECGGGERGIEMIKLINHIIADLSILYEIVESIQEVTI